MEVAATRVVQRSTRIALNQHSRLEGQARQGSVQHPGGPLDCAEGAMPASSFIDNPKHWAQRAAEMRSLAEQMNDQQSREAMLRIAEDYEKLARRTLERSDDSRSR